MQIRKRRAVPARRSPRTPRARRACGWPAARGPKVRDFGKSDGILAEIARDVALGCGLAAAWAASCLLADGLMVGVDVMRGGAAWMI